MLQSILTKKGQTTIPKKIREFLGIKSRDKLLYLIEDNKVIIKPIRGNILELRGSITPKQEPENFNSIRSKMRKEIAQKAILNE